MGPQRLEKVTGKFPPRACFMLFSIDVCDVRWIFIGAGKKIKKLDISELSELKSQTGRRALLCFIGTGGFF